MNPRVLHDEREVVVKKRAGQSPKVGNEKREQQPQFSHLVSVAHPNYSAAGEAPGLLYGCAGCAALRSRPAHDEARADVRLSRNIAVAVERLDLKPRNVRASDRERVEFKSLRLPVISSRDINASRYHSCSLRGGAEEQSRFRITGEGPS